MHINWYPGHMKKTKHLIEEHLKLVDVVVELLDARIPYSSKNPQIDDLLNDKPRVVALNKSDLANSLITKEWQSWYETKGIKAIPINCIKGDGISDVIEVIKEVGSDRINRRAAKGAINTNIRVMIVGIPNVGKSTFINALVGKKKAKTGNKPGVTRGKQWIRIRNDIDLFDTPGILWPKIEDQKVGKRLAFTGAIKDEILSIDDLAYEFIKWSLEKYPHILEKRYDVRLEETDYDNVDNEYYMINTSDPLIIMEQIAKRRGCIKKGNKIDYDKVSVLILDEFRKGLLGRISLESPNDMQGNDEG